LRSIPFLFLILSLPAFSGYLCNTDVNGITSCDESHQEAKVKESCAELSPSSELEQLADKMSISSNQEPINFCKTNVVFGGKKLTKREQRKKVRKLRRQCKKKARAYKNTVAKSLLKKFKLGQFLQAKLKSKKKIMKGSKESSQKIKIETGLEPEEISKMSREDFSTYMMAKIRKQVPSIDSLIDQSKNPRDAFQGPFNKKETFPINVVLGSKGSDKCVMKAPNFPEEDVFQPKVCELCEMTELQNNFTNDCSYMVTNSLSEKQARKLIGADSKKAAGSDKYCNNKMEDKNQSAALDKASEKLCNIAKDGYKPKFEIESSRNLYNDYTPELAKKRGLFTQKYIYKSLKEKCRIDEDEIPEWLSNQASFNEVVKVTHPTYLRPDNTEGDYGPDPTAKGDDRIKETSYLEKTLNFEKSEKFKELDSYKDRISQIDSLIEDYSKQAKLLSTRYKNTQKNISDSNFRLLEDKALILSQVSNEASSSFNQKKILQQEKSDILQRISGIETDLSSEKYKRLEGQYLLTNKLKAYYSDMDRSPANDDKKSKWDKDLFNQFKMARIKGEVSRENEFGIPEEMMTPELSIALKSLIEIKTFTCELNPIETRKTTLNGVLKGALKVVTVATLPVVTVVGAGVTVAASPITTGISLICKGCREPGNTPPILQLGNLFHLDLSSSGRREAWGSTKGFVNNYINWGGTLKVSKKRNITRHSLEAASKQRGDKSYGKMSQLEQENFVGRVIAEAQKEENQLTLNKELDCKRDLSNPIRGKGISLPSGDPSSASEVHSVQEN
jgi:hypothetical protein